MEHNLGAIDAAGILNGTGGEVELLFNSATEKQPDFLQMSSIRLISFNTHYMKFIHRQEVARKLLHVSIGLLILFLYSHGFRPLQIASLLFSAFILNATFDAIRYNSKAVNKIFIRSFGIFMRENEATSYSTSTPYLFGMYIALRYFPEDIGIVGVLLLSCCDTAASIFGRLYGCHSIQLRHGKSLIGTAAAWLVGVLVAAGFWGYFLYTSSLSNNTDPARPFMFTGKLTYLPENSNSGGASTDPLALVVISLVSGFVAAGSELVDIFGCDDNLVVPVLSTLGLWGFLKIFG
ncbi:hypothetical protein EYZ11_010886 [Aspergillus tanneri]|uniref:Phosphatidate cytidylyltransferase n=1 Tax=Aspergillus tanneri TaxID=1220188 RepID=A0A4S3J493_9EURO|nr:uncharacterized protein ATNIH1004_004712 [Aspergillus tanneri]KAA8648827.1 hypothetical protein ATNIH1004_004712 [Aspergillus tanneri]THC89660.1 hypothetical protein EYZ11_010886 [Aspergillus tanneri]